MFSYFGAFLCSNKGNAFKSRLFPLCKTLALVRASAMSRFRCERYNEVTVTITPRKGQQNELRI